MNLQKHNLIQILFFGSSIILTLFSQKRQKKRQEKDSKLIGISFGPTGGLFAYNLGVTKYIQENFILDDLKYAGISGGVQSCMLLSFNIPVENGFNNWLTPLVQKLKNRMILKIIPPWDMMDISKYYLGQCLKQYNLSTLTNKFYASVTKVFPYPHNLAIYNWKDDYNDLYSGLQASQYLPFLSGYPFCTFRNGYYIDGYITNTFFEPIYGKWIHVNPFKWTNRNVIHGILSLSNVDNIDFHKKQYEMGYEDAKKNHNYFTEKGLIEK